VLTLLLAIIGWIFVYQDLCFLPNAIAYVLGINIMGATANTVDLVKSIELSLFRNELGGNRKD